MKSLYLLTLALSLTQASNLGRFGTESHGSNLVKRIGGEWGNRPGERGYDYHQDPDWRGNRGGRISSDQLLDEDADLRRDARDPPPPLRPLFAPSPYQDRPSTSNYRYEDPRPKREAQFKRVRKISYTDAKKYDDHVLAREIGAEFPFPKQGINGYVKGIGAMGINEDYLTGGRVDVKTTEQAGTKYAAGPFYVDISRAYNQDHNPAPPPRPEPVNPRQGAPDNTYYVHGSDRRRIPVYVDGDGVLRSENSDKRIPSGKNVYLNNPRRRRSKRSPADVLGQIETTTNAPANNTDSLSADWQSYYTIYNSLRTNATNLLMPIFENLVNQSNTSYAYEMAWSIHSQLTGSPNEYSGGYYQNGQTTFSNFTDTWLLNAGFWLDSDGVIYLPQNSSIRSDNSTMLKTAQMLSANYYLETTYYQTWNASVAALNKTQDGSPHTLLEDLVYYSAVVTQTNNTSVMSENFYTINLAASEPEAAWFLDGINKYY